MPGENIGFALPTVESGLVYAPGSLAWRIQNMQLTVEGTLRSVRGPAPFIPDYGSGTPYGARRVFGVYHALLDGGHRDVTLIRAGERLYAQRGWARDLELLADDLSADRNARFPDVFVEIAGKVVWSNGVDAPLIYDGYTVKELGYARPPSAPTVLGPAEGGYGSSVFRNQAGYSHPGRMGLVGDFFTATPGSGALLDSNWSYYIQFEDVFGDRSPFSPASSALVRQEYAATSYWSDLTEYADEDEKDPLGDGMAVTLDDLTRQMCLTSIARGPRHTVARVLYRTNANQIEPRFLARIPDNVTTTWPDNAPDSYLGAVGSDYIATPHFHVACSYQGRLAVAVGNRVRLSDTGFPGSFPKEQFIDVEGGEVTGLASFGGYLYAFTEQSVFRVEFDAEGLRKRPVLEGVGAASPGAVVTTDSGQLVWLSRSSWYAMSLKEEIANIGREEAALFKRLNLADLSRAVAVWNPNTREYLCALPEAGDYGNRLIMAWDGKGWRRQRYKLLFTSLCVTKDWRRYLLAAGRRPEQQENNVWVMDHEVISYEPPTKTYKYQSAWIRRDPTGRLRFNVDTVYVGVVEANNGPVTWYLWRDGSRDTLVASGTLTLYDPNTPATLGTAVIGTTQYRNPRLTWFKFDARLVDVQSFAFDLVCEEPTYINLFGFSFDSHTTDENGARVHR